MRRGGGKAKGSTYERWACAQLSLWITGGKHKDTLWRSAMSGGRATVSNRKKVTVRQAGDITAVAPEGHVLTDAFYVECKHVKDLNIEAFCLTGKGLLGKFWTVAVREARKHNREPMIIARQNFTRDLVIMRPPAFRELIGKNPPGMSIKVRSGSGNYVELRYLDDVLACPFKG